MRGGQFSFVRTRTDNDAIEIRKCSSSASAPKLHEAGVGEAHGALARGNNPYGRAQGGAKAWAPAFDGTWRPAGLSVPTAAGTAVAMAAGGAGARAIDPLGADRVRRRHRMLFRRGSRAARVGRSSVAIGAVAVAFVARRRPFGFPLAVGTADVFAGLAIATLQTAISDASIGHGACQILIGRWLVGVVLAVGGQSCARRCVGAALSLPQARSPGPWRPPSLTLWWPATDKRRHFAARMAGSLSYAPAVTPLPSRNGWPPTPMRERPRMGVWATASPAMRSVASADSPIVAWYRLSWESRHSPRTARERQ